MAARPHGGLGQEAKARLRDLPAAGDAVMADPIKELALLVYDLNLMNCSQHCWCNCPRELAANLGFDAIREAFQKVVHEHGEPGDSCSGCLIESGKLVVTL